MVLLPSDQPVQKTSASFTVWSSHSMGRKTTSLDTRPCPPRLLPHALTLCKALAFHTVYTYVSLFLHLINVYRQALV